MRFGYCTGPGESGVLKATGYDYFEWGVSDALMPLADDAAFEVALAKIKAAALPCESLNGMVPGTLKITGPDADMAKLEAYVATMCVRAKRVGIQRIVFGSGGARNVPEGFCREKARAQILDFLKMLGPHAQAAGLLIAIEPLNKKECNIINTVAEGAEIARAVDHPSIRLLADAFHMLRDDEPIANVAKNLDIIVHTHIATRENRLPPGVEACAGIQEFLQCLRGGGYKHRVSVEASGYTPAWALTALATMRVWAL